MEESDGQYDEIDIHFVRSNPDLVSDSDEIMIDDIKRTRKTEAYTIVHLEADCDDKTNASVLVEVNTRVFERPYLKQMNLNGEPTGLKTSTTKLIAYNGMQVPQYGALRFPLIWRPSNGAKPICIQTK